MSVSKKSLKIILISLASVAVIVAGTIGFLRHKFSSDSFGTWKDHAIYLDVETPDTLIITESLSKLPKDILNVPLLKDTLTESFVFYYEEHPGKDLLKGTLKRLAYEQNLTISDELIKSVFDTPAEVYLWRGPNGQLDYWALSMEHNALAKALEGLSKVTLKDSQLAKVGEMKVDGDKVPVYVLSLSSQRAFVFASHKDRLLVLSHPEMLLKAGAAPEPKQKEKPAADSEEGYDDYYYDDPSIWKEKDSPFAYFTIIKDRANVFGDLLSSNKDTRSNLQQGFLVKTTDVTPNKGHDVFVSANYLSFAYQSFFPAIESLRFHFTDNSWKSEILVNPTKLTQKDGQLTALWQSAPTAAAACTALPLDWGSAQELASKMSKEKPNLEKMTQNVAVCWYERSPLASPLFIARFEDAASAKEQLPVLSAMFTQVIGAAEYDNKKRFPVETKQISPEITMLTRVVSATYGSHDEASFKASGSLSGARYFPVTLAQAGENIFFSPDQRLVEDAIAVYQKRLPAMADTLAQAEQTRAVITPKTLSQLFEHEVWQSLPKDREPILRSAAKEHLQPRLKALAGYEPFELRIPNMPTERKWVPLEIVFSTKPSK